MPVVPAGYARLVSEFIERADQLAFETLLIDEAVQTLGHMAGIRMFVEVVVAPCLQGKEGQAGQRSLVGAARGTFADVLLFAARVGAVPKAIGPPMSVFHLVPGQPLQPHADCRF